MTMAQLTAEKNAIKRAINGFDQQFTQAHGRAPGKVDKAHLKPLYARYKLTKRLLETAQQVLPLLPGASLVASLSCRAILGPR